jgi:hypothetical protein
MALAPLIPSQEPEKIRFWHTPAWQKWLGPCASLLCLVHCFTLPLILLLAPGVLHVIPYQFLHELELVFWILAVELGVFTLAKASVSWSWIRGFVLLSLVAPLGTFLMQPLVTHATFVVMALLQFALVFLVHVRAHSEESLPLCCEGHDHA